MLATVQPTSGIMGPDGPNMRTITSDGDTRMLFGNTVESNLAVGGAALALNVLLIGFIAASKDGWMLPKVRFIIGPSSRVLKRSVYHLFEVI